MSHITEFSISCLAGSDKVYSQKLNKDINVFFGLNGSGKTSLLKILHSAMSGNVDILKNVPFKSAEIKIYSTDSDKIFTRTIKQVNNNDGQTLPPISFSGKKMRDQVWLGRQNRKHQT